MMDYKPSRSPMPTTRCRHMIAKGMHIFGDEYLTPDNELYRTNDFWCHHTQRVMGPDNGLVVLSKCVVGRECYEPL